MARYVDSGYGTQYGRAITLPIYDGYDESRGSYSARGGGVADTRRVPQAPLGNSYQRNQFDEFGKPYQSPAATYGYGSSGKSYRPNEYGDYSGSKDWQKSGGNNYGGQRDEFHYRGETAVVVLPVVDGHVASRPGHGARPLSMPTNDIGAALELLTDTSMHSSASGSYPHQHHQHQAGSRYAETASTVYYYPEIMPPTMDPTKRYGNIDLGSRRQYY